MKTTNLTEEKRKVIAELKDCVLAMYDIRGKQSFIYRSSHLKEIVGGSAIIRDCFTDYLYPAAETIVEGDCSSKGIFYINENETQPFTIAGLYDHLFKEGYIGEVVYEGGGNYLLIFKNESIFKEVTYRFTKALMFGTSILKRYGRLVPEEEEKPGTWSLKALGTCVGNLDFEDYEKDRNRLYLKHQNNEASECINTPSGSLPIVQVSYDTSMPLVDRRPDVRNSEEKVTAESYAKYCKYKEEVKTRSNEIGEKVLDRIIRKKGEDSWLAVIYIDGNGMGAKVEDIIQEKKSYEECVNILRKYSEEIQRIYIDEPKKRIDEYLKMKYCHRKGASDNSENKVDHSVNNLKRRIVISAGDEITFICNAHDAYDIMRIYLEGLPEHYSSCAGAAIFNSHAPYNEAYRIAEECCENCKGIMREKKMTDACLMDFHYCQSGIGISLKEIRRQEVGKCISKPWLVPTKHANGEDIDATTMIGFAEDRLVARTAVFENNIGRSNVKTLADRAKRGQVELELELHRIKAHMKTEERNSTDFGFVENLEPMKKRALLYDVAIMYDLWFRTKTNGGGDK